MIRFSFDLIFHTIAFIGSASPELYGEFSVKALKASMRFWWRQFQDQTDTRALFEQERQIFGSTSGAPSFSMCESDSSGLSFDSSGNGFSVPSQFPGIAYLYYSCITRGVNQPGRRRWILPNSRVRIDLSFRRNDEDLIKKTLFALWCAQTFSGIGSRARRGGGSYQLYKAEIPTAYETFVEQLYGLTAKTLMEALRDGPCPSVVKPFIYSSSPLQVDARITDHFKEFPIKHTATPDEILESIGIAMRNFRTHRHLLGGTRTRHRFHNEAHSLHGSASASSCYMGPNPLRKTAFGLPIQYRFTGANYTVTAKPARHERRASPLFITIKKDRRGCYYANLTLIWQNPFLESGEGIVLTKRENRREVVLGTVNQPNATAIEEFLRSLP